MDTGAKVGNVTDAAPAASDAVQSLVRFFLKFVQIAMKHCCIVQSAFSNELDTKHELNTCFSVYRNAVLTLAEITYNTCTARGQASSAQAFSPRSTSSTPLGVWALR